MLLGRHRSWLITDELEPALDYMLELATRVFRDTAFLMLPCTAREAGNEKPEAQGTPKKTWDSFLGEKIEEVFGRDGALYWYWRDERSLEHLAEIFYRNPGVAASIVEEGESGGNRANSGESLKEPFCPKFILMLSEEELTEKLVVEYERREEKKSERWRDQIRSILKDTGMHIRWKTAELLSKFAIHIDSGRTYSALEPQVRLLRNPSLVKLVAEKLQAAVGFSLVLDAELDEIEQSRRERLRRDFDAEAGKLIAKLQILREREKELRSRASATPIPKTGEDA